METNPVTHAPTASAVDGDIGALVHRCSRIAKEFRSRAPGLNFLATAVATFSHAPNAGRRSMPNCEKWPKRARIAGLEALSFTNVEPLTLRSATLLLDTLCAIPRSMEVSTTK